MKVTLITTMDRKQERYVFTEADYQQHIDLCTSQVDVKSADLYDNRWNDFLLNAKIIDWSMISDDLRMDVINTLAAKYEYEIYGDCQKDPFEENSWVYTLTRNDVKVNSYLIEALKEKLTMVEYERMLTSATQDARNRRTMKVMSQASDLIIERFINTKTPLFCIDHISFHTAMNWYAKQHLKFSMNTKQIINQLRKEFVPKEEPAKKTKKKNDAVSEQNKSNKIENVESSNEVVSVVMQHIPTNNETQDIVTAETKITETEAKSKTRKTRTKKTASVKETV